MTQRRILMNASDIEDIIAAGQRRGLTATQVSHYPDGRCDIHFGEGDNERKAEATSWKV